MFDAYARSLLADVPDLDGLTGDATARALSSAYLSLLHYRTNGTEALKDVGPTLAFLRRLANGLLFHVVLDEARDGLARRAAAFVAAESLALLSDFIAATASHAEEINEVFRAERMARVEAALLYLFAEYDACAAGVLTLGEPPASLDKGIDERAASWCFANLEALCKLRLDSRSVVHRTARFGFRRAEALDPHSLEQDTIGRLYVELATVAAEFASWLLGVPDRYDRALRRLDRLIATLSPTVGFGPSRIGHAYARVFHLATLMNLTLPAVGTRALCHTVPPPPHGDPEHYRQYLITRAQGTENTPGRPLLWPSAAKYVEKCLLGNATHAVVSMPTGSGKSFLAELAVSQALCLGWVLYLAPTNALAEQIRGDLRVGLASLNTEVLAFIGDQEYSIFGTDTVSQMSPNCLAVMTPEKCALALRLVPKAFANCSLVVVDECHLLGDGSSARGPVAELVLTQLMLRSPIARFLLMSAIVQNPEDLAGWLAHALKSHAEPVTIRWRPTRTLRSVLGVENESFQAASAQAKKRLEQMKDNRRKQTFTSKCALAACLQGAWQSTDEADYGVVTIDCDADLSVQRTKLSNGSWRYRFNPDSWVNGTAVVHATLLAEKGIQTLVFTPRNRHYPFSNGAKVELDPGAFVPRDKWPPQVATYATLSEYELGCESAVFSLFEKGVAVHTSSMLEVEKIASETMFKQRFVPLMFATGTLAQGLNLPAIAVVIAGTTIGDPRGEDVTLVEQRKFSQLLNAAGRAGRAGFANQGVVITIPDDPILMRDFKSVLEARDNVNFLQKADDAVVVESGLDDFLDSVCAEVISAERASDLDLQVVAMLTGGDAKQLEAEEVLRRTYAAYRRKCMKKPDLTHHNAERLKEVRDRFVADSHAPEWITVAAQRAGLDFFLTLAISSVWGRYRPQLPKGCRESTVMEWLDEFLQVASMLPPYLLERILSRDQLAKAADQFKELQKKHSVVFSERRIGWNRPPEWDAGWQSMRRPLAAWMAGNPIRDIAAILTRRPAEHITSDRTSGKPIPQALGLTMDVWSSLALLAGGFLAVAEQVFHGDVPLPLACLPMCIKYGCDSPGTLAWFRFGVRLRRASRLLAAAYPPPDSIQSDDELRTWVRRRRREWLRREDPTPTTDLEAEAATFDAIREFITS
jgi:DEAD/DEAH box helicase